MGERFALVANNFLGDPDRYEGVNEEQLIGGAEITLYRMGQLLLDMGHEVRVIQEETDTHTESFHGLKVVQVSVPDTSARLRRLVFNLRYWDHVPAGSYVHLHSDELALPRHRNINSINQQGLTWDYPGRRNIATRIKLRFLQRALATGAYIRASDSSFLTYVQSEWTQYRNQVYPIPNGVDLDRFQPRSVDSEDLFGESLDRPIVLFPRTLRIARGAHIFIDAMAKLISKEQSATAVFLGAQRNDITTDIDRRIRRHGLDESMYFAGHIPNEQMPRYYNAADIVSIPTYHSEGSSVACIEAMACGCPVVVTDIGGLKELIYQSEVDGGLKTKPSADSLAQALRKIANDEKYRRRLGKRARKRAERYYAIERWRDDMREYFDRVLEKTTPV